MGKVTPSMAKNIMKRALMGVVFPYPTQKEKDKVWKYFNYSCIYCGKEIDQKSRKGHLDHLIPISDGGTNSIYNFVLSCDICNGDEKRDKNWEEFLKEKNEEKRFKEKKEKILEWHKKFQYLEDIDRIKLKKLINNAKTDFDKYVEEAKKLKIIKE